MQLEKTLTKSKSGLRILHLASWYPSAMHSTLGNFVQRHVQAIAALHPGEVWYAAPVPRGTNAAPHSVEVKHLEGLTERITYFSQRKPVVQGVTRALLNLAKNLESLPPFDVIHLHVAYPAGKTARILAKRWNIPLVLTEHWTAYHREQRQRLSYWHKLSMRQTGQMAALICPVSNDLAQSMREFGIEGTYQTVPNVVDTSIFKPLSSDDRTVKSSGESVEILHISSLLDSQKNITGLLHAAAESLARSPHLSLTIIGGGDPSAHIQTAQQLGIAERIHIEGEIDLSEVARRMRHADALVLFSHFENFPCVIPEAWSSGIPVISSDVGGIGEWLNETNGILVPANDQVALTNALDALANRSRSWNSDQLRAQAIDTFSREAVAQCYSSIYARAQEAHVENASTA